jgi:hypothetical protein
MSVHTEQGLPAGTGHPTPSGPARRALTSPTTAVVAVWTCSALLAVFAPDMVTGSEHDHLPIAAMTVWPWTFAATAYVVMAVRHTTSAWLVMCVAAIWTSVLIAGVAAPVMVTGTDPTRIPMGAIMAPIGGALATGLVALHHATRLERHPAGENA